MHRAWDSWLLSISSFPSASCKRQLWPISTFGIFDQMDEETWTRQKKKEKLFSLAKNYFHFHFHWPISTFGIFDQMDEETWTRQKKKNNFTWVERWPMVDFFVASLSVLKHLNFARQEGKCSWIALIWKEFLWGAAPDGWLDGWTDRSPLLATTTAIPSTFRMHVVYWYIGILYIVYTCGLHVHCASNWKSPILGFQEYSRTRKWSICFFNTDVVENFIWSPPWWCVRIARNKNYMSGPMKYIMSHVLRGQVCGGEI